MALISVGNIALGSAAQEGLSAIASSYAKSAETASVPWSAIEYSGTVITAISGSAIGGGGGAPFDSATCSAIASSYAESAASSKLDSTASGNFLTSETVTALGTATASVGDVPTNVVTSVNETYISSTYSMDSDHAYSADYDPSGRPLTSLVATSDMSAYQPSGAYLTTADSATILSSSVVTATGGSGSYVTSINGSGISGAGGTTESTVSSIASAYADSAASSKLDKTESSKYVLTSQSSIFLTSTVVTATAGSNGYVTAINGSGLSGAGGGADPATVSAIASAYAESAASGKQDSTGMSAYAYESSNSAKLDTTAQVVSSTAGDGTYVTAINGMGLSGAGGGGDTSNCFPKTASSLLQPVGDYLSSTDSALFYPMTGNPSGFINSSEQVVTAISDDGVYITSINGKGLSGAGGTSTGGAQVVTATGGTSTYVTSINGSAISGIAPLDSATVSAIASSYAESAASSKLDTTAQVVTATGWNGTYITSINGVGLSGAGGGGGGTSIEYSGIAPVVVDNTASSISLTNIPLDVDSTLTAYSEDGTIYFGLANSAEYMRSGNMTAYQLTANMSSYQLTSNMSSYQLTSNMSSYQLTSNMSSYQQTADMSAYQKTADMSGYFQTSAPLIPYSALEYSGATTIITGISGSSLGASQFANPIKVVYGSGLQTSVSSDADDNKTLNVEVSANMGGLGIHVLYTMQEVWTASAVDQRVPYGQYVGTPAGYNPYYVNWYGVLDAPYNARFDLVQSSDLANGTPFGEQVIDSCYVEAGNSAFVKLQGVTYGWGNNIYMRSLYVKVHWAENPLNATITTHAQNGYFCDLCMGTTIGPYLTFPYNP